MKIFKKKPRDYSSRGIIVISLRFFESKKLFIADYQLLTTSAASFFLKLKICPLIMYKSKSRLINPAR